MKISKYLKLLGLEWGVEVLLCFILCWVGLAISFSIELPPNASYLGQILGSSFFALVITGLVVATRVLFLQIPASVYFRRREVIKNGFSLLQTLKIVLLVYIPSFSLFLLIMKDYLIVFDLGLVLSTCIPPCITALAAPYLTYHWKGQLFESHFDKRQ